jgi:murein DD-endopeptidase MepM/ murein hydrolase activator NlpD
MRFLLAVVIAALLACGGVYVYAGRMPGPSIEITKPLKYVGVSTPVEVRVTTPQGKLTKLDVFFEQNSKQTLLFSLEKAQTGGTNPTNAQLTATATVTAGAAPTGPVLTTTIDREKVPDLKSGAGRIVVTAVRPVLFGLRKAQSTAAHDVQVRLERPQIAVISTKHYINLGGSEMIVYRATPSDVESGVMVGDVRYPGYPASGVKIEGVHIADPAVKVAFFALRWDQNVNTPMYAFAQDEAGNSGRAEFDHLTFPKAFKRSTIPIDDKFIGRTIPWIYENSPEVKTTGNELQDFLQANGKLRQINAQKISSYSRQSASELFWGGVVFHAFVNNAVEAAFADHRTYVYNGKEVDQQTHLGFDLARVVNSPVVAANKGKVLHAGPLGIYGNAIIVDHGMGVQSLYGHLSSIGVKVGDMVEKEQEMGRTGTTGLAGGDHVHFTMLVSGQMVNPIEWWDAHWIQDRILRKLRDASQAPGTSPMP